MTATKREEVEPDFRVQIAECSSIGVENALSEKSCVGFRCISQWSNGDVAEIRCNQCRLVV